MRDGSVPKGQTRISDAVVDAIVVVAARNVQGVVDVVGLARGAPPGPVDGDGGRALREAPADTVFHKKNQETLALRLHLSAEDGADLSGPRQLVLSPIRRFAIASQKSVDSLAPWASISSCSRSIA